MYVNDLPQHTTTSSAALLADDTISVIMIRQDLQRDMDGSTNGADYGVWP